VRVKDFDEPWLFAVIHVNNAAEIVLMFTPQECIDFIYQVGQCVVIQRGGWRWFTNQACVPAAGLGSDTHPQVV
jgi:hypothetical protein